MLTLAAVEVVQLVAAMLDVIPLLCPKPRKPPNWQNRSESPTPSNSHPQAPPALNQPTLAMPPLLRPVPHNPHQEASHPHEAVVEVMVAARAWQWDVVVVKVAVASSSHHPKPPMMLANPRAPILCAEEAMAMAVPIPGTLKAIGDNRTTTTKLKDKGRINLRVVAWATSAWAMLQLPHSSLDIALEGRSTSNPSTTSETSSTEVSPSSWASTKAK
jgi:hypothetical protein